MILCLETATALCSVALCNEKGVISLRENDEGKSHASSLTPFIIELLNEAGIRAGELEAVFLEGVKLVDQMFRVSVDRRAEIVVASCGGSPADINLFQAYKAVDGALEVVKRGGVIILVAECSEGHGSQVFFDWMVKFADLKSIEREIKRNFVLGGHKAYYLLKALQNHQIILVSSLPDYYATNIFKLKTARAVNDALNEAFNIVGKAAKVWTIPQGNYTLPEVKANLNEN